MNKITGKIYVGVPHKVVVIENAVYDGVRRKMIVRDLKPKVVACLPSDGKLNATINTTFNGVTEQGGIPVFDKEVVNCDPLPEGYDIYIVSAMYAKAYAHLFGYSDKLYCVADAVYTYDGNTTIGCKGICPSW
jgi:hypothetical protein